MSKTTRAKTAGDMAQVIEHLPMKHKALTSNLRTKRVKNVSLLQERERSGKG
jgi:hypothetical protein